MASAVNAIASAASSNPSAATQLSTSSNQNPNEQMFLQLLVAQMKNQDPETPTDPTAFVSELAQFSELEQVIGIRGDIEQYMGINQTSATGSGQTTNQSTGLPTSPNTGQTNNS